MGSHRVALIEGDGVGPELVKETLRVLEHLQSLDPTFSFAYERVEGGAATQIATGYPLGVDNVSDLKQFDAMLKGPVGLPGVRGRDGTEAGLLGGILRGGLDLFANVRPIRQMVGVKTPLAEAEPRIDYVIARENTEGLYASRGRGIQTQMAAVDMLFVTRFGSERIARYAFELAMRRHGAPRDLQRRVTCVDKSNVLGAYALFRNAVTEIASAYPEVELEFLYADAAAQALVMNPQHFDVIVTENFLGDILTDLGGATVGGVGFCPSGNYGDTFAYFEPAHGSAPSLAGKNRVNPIAQILSAAMMLDHLGEGEAANRIRGAVAACCAVGSLEIDREGQMPGGTHEFVNSIIENL